MKDSLNADHDGSPQAVAVEQRREPRRPARGRVTIETRRGPVMGQLVDVSDHGFRMVHADLSLEAGSEVAFAHSLACGTARVMWNRITNRRVESGFLILGR